MLFQNILLPVDFSAFTAETVAIAQQMARRYHSQLTLAHVLLQSPSHLDETADEDLRVFMDKRELSVLQQFQVQFEGEGKPTVPMKFVTLRGTSPVDALNDILKSGDYDLVMLARYGDTGYRHAAIGGVAEKLVQLSPAPVMVIGRSQPRSLARRLLVPIDFSNYSRKSVEYAGEIARTQHAKITFMHVVEQEIYPSFYASSRSSAFDIDPGLSESVRMNLQEFVADIVEDALIDDFIIKEGLAHQAIVEQCKGRHDLLILASHGLTGLEYMMLGGTAEKVVRWSQCPILLVKHSEGF